VSNAAPCTPNSHVVVTVHVAGDTGGPVAGADVTATWHYKSTDPQMTAATGSSGDARFDRSISRATAGYTVVVDADAAWSGLHGAGSTSFTPRAC
jgi:hypothetical protein